MADPSLDAILYFKNESDYALWIAAIRKSKKFMDLRVELTSLGGLEEVWVFVYDQTSPYPFNAVPKRLGIDLRWKWIY